MTAEAKAELQQLLDLDPELRRARFYVARLHCWVKSGANSEILATLWS